MANPYLSKASGSLKLQAKAHKIAKESASEGYASPFKHTLKDTDGGFVDPAKNRARGGRAYTGGADTGVGRIEKKNKYGL